MASVGLDHGHIFGQTNGLTEAGAVWLRRLAEGDNIGITPDGPRFKRRLFLYDSRIIETLLVIPL